MISPLEMSGVALNIGGVWLTARRNMLCWPVGIVGVAVYGVLFWQWKLYGDMALQGLYVATQIYGWWCWRRGTPMQATRPALVRADPRHLTLELLVTAGCSVLLAWVMVRWTNDAMPRADATLTCFSLLATLWAARRHVQNWYLWIAVDTAYTILFVVRHDPMTAFLYGMFTVLAAYGVRAWRTAAVGAAEAD